MGLTRSKCFTSHERRDEQRVNMEEKERSTKSLNGVGLNQPRNNRSHMERNRESRRYKNNKDIEIPKKNRRNEGFCRDTRRNSSVITNYSDSDNSFMDIESTAWNSKSVPEDRRSTISINGSNITFELPDYGKERSIFIINCPTNRSTTSGSQIQQQSNAGEIFKCGYTVESLERTIQRKNKEIPYGNFIDYRKIPLRNKVRILHELSKWSHSVCQIRFRNGTATGFRVGSRYIMTASHVVWQICTSVIHDRYDNFLRALTRRDVFCLFDYIDDNQTENVKRFDFKSIIHFYDEETDTAVLELDGNEHSMPPPFEVFGFPDIDGYFTFLGHMGSGMEYNTVDLIIDKENERTREDIHYVKEYNDRKTPESYDFPPNNKLTNEHRILFHCKFGKGASGSPGILVLDDEAVVVTMLLCGYPNWYYDDNVDRDLITQWPKEYCIEQGADMMSVESKLYGENRALCRDIFRKSRIPFPSL